MVAEHKYMSQIMPALSLSILVKNIFTNYFSVMLIGGTTLVLIPMYLHFLGKEQWGGVAICLSVQGFMNLLDMGISQIMPRDVARISGNPAEEARVFKLYAYIYLCMGGAGFLVVQMLLNSLVHYWIQDPITGDVDIVLAIRIVLFQFVFQFINNVNIGFWNGIQAQVRANVHTCVFFLIKNIFALFLIVFWNASIFSYVIAFALCAFLEMVINFLCVLFFCFKNTTFPLIDFTQYLSVFGETIKFGSGVAVGVFAFQLDRAILPKFVDIGTFGYYLVILNIGMAFFQFQYPMIRAFLPYISRRGSMVNSVSSNRLIFYVFGCCCIPCLIAIIFSPIILDMWLSDRKITEFGTLPLRIILLSIIFNSLYQIIYLRIISFGRSSVVFKINFVVFMLVLPFSVLLIQQFAAVGAACIWLLAATIQLFSGLVWLHYHKKNS